MDGIGSLVVDPSNTDQAKAWDGPEGSYWAEHRDVFERSLLGYDAPFHDAARVDAGDRVLDIGCGTGWTTRALARLAGSGTVLGVDLSAAMLDVARRTAASEHLTNARFQQGDAQVYDFDKGSFDVAVSRTGCMFFGDPAAAFANIGRALRPGGRLALLVWQPLAQNEWLASISGTLAAGRQRPAPPPDAPGPLSMSDPSRCVALLEGAGFADVELAGVEAPLWFGYRPDQAHQFILGLLGWMLDGLEEPQRREAEDSLLRLLEEHHVEAGVLLGSAAWLVTGSVRTQP